MRFLGQTFGAELIERIRAAVSSGLETTRSGLSRRVCEWLDWRSVTGQLREIDARKALLALERAGCIELPPPQAEPPQRRRAPQAVAEGAEVVRHHQARWAGTDNGHPFTHRHPPVAEPSQPVRAARDTQPSRSEQQRALCGGQFGGRREPVVETAASVDYLSTIMKPVDSHPFESVNSCIIKFSVIYYGTGHYCRCKDPGP